MNKYINTKQIEPYLHREEHGTPDERWRPESEFARIIDSIPSADVVEGIEIIEWHEVKKRKPTKEEQAEFDERDIGKVPYILIGDMPENGEEILIATPYGVSTDICGLDYDYGYYLEDTGDWDDVIAWAKMPKGIRERKETE